MATAFPSLQGVRDWIAPRRNTLLGMSAGFLSGDLGKAPLYAMQGAEADDAYATAQKQEAERQKALQDTQALRAKYADFFRQQNEPELADLVGNDQGPAPGDVYWKWRDLKAGEMGGGSSAPASIREWEYYNALPAEQQGQYLRMKRANPYLDIGTGFVQPDPVNPGQTAGPAITKDLQGAEMDKAVGKGVGEQIMDMRTAAFDAQSSLSATKAARDLLDKGVITGFGADFMVGMGKALQQIGFNVAPDAIANTEAFVATRAQEVGRLIKMFGAGTGLSDADREFATRAAAGSVEMTEASIRRILDINERASQAVIDRYNEMVTPLQGRGSIPSLTVGGQSPSAPPPAITDVDTILNGYGL